MAGADSTAIYVALIGAVTTIVAAALALLGVWFTARSQSQLAQKDRQIAALEERLDAIEARAPTPEKGDP